MPTSNEQIADQLTAHVIGLRRVASGLAKRIIRLLEQVEPDLRKQILRRVATIERNGGIDAGPVTTARLLRLQDRIRAIQAPLWQEVRNDTKQTLIEVGQWEQDFTATAVNGSLPVNMEFERLSARRLRRIVTSRPFQGKVLSAWMSQYETNDRRRMMDAVRVGLVQNETPTQIARRIFGTSSLNLQDGQRAITRRGAQALAQTSVAAISNATRSEWAVENKGIVKEELFVATLDSKTTPICRSLDGRRWPPGEGRIPPIHINCRSTRVPLIDGDVIGTRPSVAVTAKALKGLKGEARRKKIRELVGQVPAGQTYEQWLRKQSREFQDEVLGKTKARLFRDGGLTLDRFVDRNDNELTIAQLRKREKEAFQKAGIGGDLQKKPTKPPPTSGGGSAPPPAPPPPPPPDPEITTFPDAPGIGPAAYLAWSAALSKKQKAFVAKERETSRKFVLENGVRDNVEYMRVFDPVSGFVDTNTSHKVDTVGWTNATIPKLYDPTAVLIMDHNHPSNSAFSFADVKLTGLYPGIRETWATGHKGSRVKVTGVAAEFLVNNAQPLKSRWNSMHKRMTQIATAYLEAGRFTNAEWQRLWSHLRTGALGKQGVLEGYETDHFGEFADFWNANKDTYEEMIEAAASSARIDTIRKRLGLKPQKFNLF